MTSPSARRIGRRPKCTKARKSFSEGDAPARRSPPRLARVSYRSKSRRCGCKIWWLLMTLMYGPAVRCKRDFVDLSALRSCINVFGLMIGACAPGHHGYQRTCVLISGQASTGPLGSPGFARAGKTVPPSRLILSQTSAGNVIYVIALS